MSDVEIVFPKGREVAVRRLHEALAETGYDVGSREVGEEDRAPAGKDTGAVLILWDRSTMAHPGLQAAAAAARSRDRAIDVSVDGITPLDLDDDRKLVHLSGWRGDAHHPGWRKILARLDALCARRAAPLPRAAAAPPRTGGTRPDGAGTARSPGRGRALLAAAMGILVGVVALAALLLSRGPQAASPQGPSPAVTPPAAASQTTPAETAQPETAPVAAPLSPPPRSTSTGEAAVPPAAQSPEASEGRPVAAPDAPVPERARSPRPSHDRHRPAIRYTRYSRTMRLFCERTGRGTPECRLFNEATRP